jgi:glutathione S-transferase
MKSMLIKLINPPMGALLAFILFLTPALTFAEDQDKAIAASLAETFPAWTVEPYIHWSGHVSLYSAKTRSYMIKKGLNFIETTPYAGVAGDKDRWKNVIMKEKGFFSIPVLDLPDGSFVSDTTGIIRYLEKQHPLPRMQPVDPVMNALNWLIFSYGTEGLFLNAQHYRWDFKDAADYAAFDIGRALGDPADMAGIKKKGKEFQAMKQKRFATEVGITDKTRPAIEKSNTLLFAKLDTYFRHYPYILGGRPSVADAALMEALHAHLGRDVYPAQIMKKTAPALFRWTETMDFGHYVPDAELSQVPQKYLDADNLPPQLMDFLKLMADDFGPLFEANAKAYEEWLAANPDAAEGTRVTDDQANMNRQAMGRAVYKLQGVTVERDAWPDTVNMHQYVLEVVDAMSDKDKARWTKLMKSIGGEVFLGHRPSRPVVLRSDRKPYQIVLGPKTK